MKLKVSNIKFESHVQQIKIPKDVQPIREWLQDYEIPVPVTDRECLLIYIRTLVFESITINYDYELVEQLEVSHQPIVFCIDALDHTYDEYETVDIEISWPETFDCVPDQLMLEVHKDDTQTLIFDYLREYMPVRIDVMHWSEDYLRQLVIDAFKIKEEQTIQYIATMLTDHASFNGDAMAADKAEHNILDFIKGLEAL